MSSSLGYSTSKESVSLFSNCDSSWRSMVPELSVSKVLKALRSSFLATSRVSSRLELFIKLLLNQSSDKLTIHPKMICAKLALKPIFIQIAD